MTEVHSTAAEGAVTHVDKWGESMPITRPTTYRGLHSVHHHGEQVGFVQELNEGRWLSHHPLGESPRSGGGLEHIKEHTNKRDAVDSLFRNISGNDPDQAKHERDREIGRRTGLTREEVD